MDCYQLRGTASSSILAGSTLDHTVQQGRSSVGYLEEAVICTWRGGAGIRCRVAVYMRDQMLDGARTRNCVG